MWRFEVELRARDQKLCLFLIKDEFSSISSVFSLVGAKTASGRLVRSLDCRFSWGFESCGRGQKRSMASLSESEGTNRGGMWELDQNLDQPMDEEATRLKNMYREKVWRFSSSVSYFYYLIHLYLDAKTWLFSENVKLVSACDQFISMCSLCFENIWNRCATLIWIVLLQRIVCHL